MKRRYFMPAICLAIAMLIAGCAQIGDEGADTVPVTVTDPGSAGGPGESAVSEPGSSEGTGSAPERETGAASNQDSSEGSTPEPEETRTPETSETASEEGPAAPSQPSEPPQTGDPAEALGTGALRVEGTRLVDGNGDPVQLRGISTHGLAWYPQYVNGELFRELAEEWGANAVRLAMYTAEYGGYCAGGDREELFGLVTDGARYAGDAGMYVIVDWHILSDGDPNTYKSDAVDFFDRVSRELAGRDNVLYEICNEPNGGTSWAQVKSYAEEIIPAIRANDPDAVILVGTPNWCQYVDEAAKDPIEGYDNIMYTLHFYAGTHKGELRERMKNAVAGGLPIFVSEFGVCDASGNGAVDTAEADRWVEAMDELGISYMMWSLSNKDESASAISSSCGKTEGFTMDDLSESGRWLVRTLSGRMGESAGAAKPSKPEGPSQTPEASQTVVPEEPETSGATEGPLENITWELKEVNSWQDGGGEYRQYSLTVKNTGSAATERWRVEIPLEGELVNSWNGVFTRIGGVYTVENMDYNGTLPPGATARDIGIILLTSKG